MLAGSRLLLGMGEGGGFPAATRVVAEWFPASERSTAMGIINAGTGVGGMLAPPLIALVLTRVHWINLSSWRWVFFLTGISGLIWTVWWIISYSPPAPSPARANANVRGGTDACQEDDTGSVIPLARLFRFKETWGLMFAKFLSDAAWYFYLFWLPKYLFDARHFDIKGVGSVAWIPSAAAGIGCLCGGTVSSWLLNRGQSLNASRKIALAASAIVMPCVIAVPYVSVPAAIALFSVAFFGQQSWSTLVMTLPTDLYPRRTVGTVAGIVGLGGAMGGVILGQFAGYLLDHGVSYGPILALAGSLHIVAFAVIAFAVPRVQRIEI